MAENAAENSIIAKDSTKTILSCFKSVLRKSHLEEGQCSGFPKVIIVYFFVDGKGWDQRRFLSLRPPVGQVSFPLDGFPRLSRALNLIFDF
jgi:hypothetical protein